VTTDSPLLNPYGALTAALLNSRQAPTLAEAAVVARGMLSGAAPLALTDGTVRHLRGMAQVGNDGAASVLLLAGQP
jgi:hypothetical protein